MSFFNTKTYGTFIGTNASAAVVDIRGKVQSISVRLDDALDGNAGSMMSVSLSPVTYCGTQAIPCPDSDGDGVCDVDDICPGFNDTIDTNGNGIPDGCESACVGYTGNFSKNPLTNYGTGFNATTLNLPTNSQDASFTLSGLSQKTKRKKGSLYIENIVVSYVDGSGVSKTYGIYNGSNVSSATINIIGKVKSITVSLNDLNGNTSSTMRINLSTVTYCIGSSSSSQAITSTKEVASQLDYDTISKFGEPIETVFRIYPNPASNKLFIKSIELNDTQAKLFLYNLQGTQVRSMNLKSKNDTTAEFDIHELATGCIYCE